MNRLNPREASAFIFYRYTMRLSISHIAEVSERSTRTVHRILSKNSWLHKLYDKRKHPPKARALGNWNFLTRLAKLSWFFELWKDGIIGNIRLLTGMTMEGKPP